MSNLDAQSAATCIHAPGLDGTVKATDPHAQSLVPSNQPGANQDWVLLATFRFAAGDLQRALTRIDFVKDDQTQWLFTNGMLLLRKCSDTITCQAAVRVTNSTGESVGFSISDQELAQFDDILSEFCVRVHGFGCDREVVFSVTHVFASEESQVVVRCDPLWQDEINSPPSGKVLPASLLHEAMRVVQPFARKRERNQYGNFAPSRLVKMTTKGLGCITADLQCVHFMADELLDMPWFMPVEISAKVRKFVRDLESFSISADDTFTYISDGKGSFISWDTPTDVDARLPCHALRIDQFVSSVSAKGIERAVKHIKSCVPDTEAVAALRVS